MNKEEFLSELAAGLTNLNEQERQRVLDYYRELICDGVENGKSEETIIHDFGPLPDIIAQITSEYGAATAKRPTAPGGQSYEAQGEVGAIFVSAENNPIEIRQVPSNKVRVLYTPLDIDNISVSEENGVFTFSQTVKHLTLLWFDLFHMTSRPIILEIPEAFHGNLTAQTSNSRITADCLHHLSTASLTSSNSRIVVTNSEFGSLQAKTSNSTIELLNCSGQSCSAKTSNSRIHAEGCSFPSQFLLHTSNASIHAENAASDNILLKSCNGPINATIVGDSRAYTIHSHTSNSHSNLPSDWSYPGQVKHLSAETSNAHIDIKFLPIVG
ncbi:MAG: DUF1700 domain-containing protein [Oscillospiraceae bacterium]|jgi:DUF4097 and DUF4098 domain-containing protein YvlB|nr:DUF1700 domain-containing protein [Oscillospiraceae bacterium]